MLGATVQCLNVKFATVHCKIIQCSVLQYIGLTCSILPFNGYSAVSNRSMCKSGLYYSAVHHSDLCYSALCYITDKLHCTAVCYNFRAQVIEKGQSKYKLS